MIEGYIIPKKKKKREISIVLKNKVSISGDAEMKMRLETIILQIRK